MVQRILIGISALLAGVLVTWFVANAGVGMKAPDIMNQTWLNSAPLHLSDLKGKVVMGEFWTSGCYNCRNVEPYVKQWHQKYADKGLVIICLHSPEISCDHDVAKVKHYI
jgi:thiol-disulfide isomerase/thioredoxin